MEQNRQKIVNLISVSAGVALAYISFILMGALAASYDLEARVQNVDLIIRGTSSLLGLALFIYFYRSDRTNQYLNEVVAELSRVTWPTGTETQKTTVVVIIMVMIAGSFLGGLDSFWTWLVQFIL